MIRGISEAVIYGDQKKDRNFEYSPAIIFSVFCEKNVMGHLERFLDNNLDEVHIQILQTISILIQNIGITNQLCFLFDLLVVYIMSHKAMNTIISKTYNFNNSEVVNYYIAFLKSLSVRLNDETLMFFFNEVMWILIIEI